MTKKIKKKNPLNQIQKIQMTQKLKMKMKIIMKKKILILIIVTKKEKRIIKDIQIRPLLINIKIKKQK